MIVVSERVCSRWYNCGAFQIKGLLWRTLCLKKWRIEGKPPLSFISWPTQNSEFNFIDFESWKQAFYKFDVKRVRCVRVAVQEIAKLQYSNRSVFIFAFSSF